MKVLITGASGLIGTALSRSLVADGHEVIRLERQQSDDPTARFWDPAQGVLNPVDVEGFDAVVHLAGAGIGDKRWTPARKRLIRDSRLAGTELLADRLANAVVKPEVLISGSAIGYYGDRAEPVSENDGSANPPDFLSELCVDWEAASVTAAAAGIRTVQIRTGLVLAKTGGALGKLLLPFRLGLGGKLGRGQTWWSWISIDDHIRAIRHLLDQPIEGPVNLTAPNPVTNAELTRALGQVMRRPAFIPVPRIALEILLGKELAEALLFTSAQILPKKLEDSGFEFAHSDIKTALQAVLAD